MRFTRRLLLLAASSTLVLSVAVLPAAVLAQTQVQPSDPWAQSASDIPVDSNVRFGVLPNGMRYAILHNATPPGQASLRLRIDAGSLFENDDQLGLAHFMEHMAFNGTTNIPENDLLQILERLGLAFGADTNAGTGFDETFYRLELPNTRDETVDASLRIMREQVSEALMAPAAIDAERGVIVGEERTRNTPQLRAQKAQLALLAPGQRISNRFPIGDLEIIRNAPRERFVDFYNAYYRPSRATMIAVGDFDVDAMEAKIRSAFESWTPKAADGPEPDQGTVAPRQPETSILVEPGTQSLIQLNWIKAPDVDPDTVAERREQTLRGLGLAALNRRMAEIARGDNPPFLGAAAVYASLVQSLDRTVLLVAFNPGGWKPALERTEQEQRRLIQFGITEAELQREITEYRTGLENAVNAAATRVTPALAGALQGSVNGDTVFSTPATTLTLFNAAVADLGVDEVNAAIRTAFQGGGPLVLFTSPVEVDGDAEAVTAALNASREVPVTAREAAAAIAWPYDTFGAPGTPAERSEITDLGATLVTFTNGARLTVKPTTFRDEQILVSVRLGQGLLSLPRDRAGAIRAANDVLTAGGLGKLTEDQLEQALAGKVYSANFAIDEDSYQLSGATRPSDLLLEMQLLAAYVTDPGLRPAPLEQYKSQYPTLVERSRSSPGGVLGQEIGSLLASGDKRFANPAVVEVAGWTIEDVRSQLAAATADGPIEIVMVGDVTVDDAIAAVSATFGALPARPAAVPKPVGSDEVSLPAPTSRPINLTHTGPADQAIGMVLWPTVDAVNDRTESRLVSTLNDVVQLRLNAELRERLGIVYSPSSQASSSTVYRDYGFLLTLGQVSPESLGQYFEAIDTIAASLRNTLVTEDELNRARRPAIEALRRSQAGNGYWLRQLQGLHDAPENAEQIRTAVTDIEAFTPADVQRAAQAYLKSDRAWRAQITAESAATPAGQ